MRWIDKLQDRWELKNTRQVLVVLLVFALTGTTIYLLKPYVLALFDQDVKGNTWFSIAYYILILPVYNVILLVYGALFGQFQFFWKFEKKMWGRIVGRKNNEADQ